MTITKEINITKPVRHSEGLKTSFACSKMTKIFENFHLCHWLKFFAELSCPEASGPVSNNSALEWVKRRKDFFKSHKRKLNIILKRLLCVHGARKIQMAVDWGYICHFFPGGSSTAPSALQFPRKPGGALEPQFGPVIMWAWLATYHPSLPRLFTNPSFTARPHADTGTATLQQQGHRCQGWWGPGPWWWCSSWGGTYSSPAGALVGS